MDNVHSHIKVSVGPLGTCVEDLEMFMRAVCSEQMFELDPYVFPIKFNSEQYQEFSTRKNLKIGYFTYNGLAQCTDSVIRAVTMTKEKLEAMGHTLIEFVVPEPEKMLKSFLAMLFADGGAGLENALQGEKEVWFYASSKLNSEHPWVAKALFALAGKVGFGRLAKYFKTLKPLTSQEYVQEFYNILDYREMFIGKWEELELDAMICPTMPFPAP
jgi:fatty acid amide hydrolase